eukprot:gene30725-37125_t
MNVSPSISDTDLDRVIQSPNRIFKTTHTYEDFNLYEYVRTEMFGVGPPGQFTPHVREDSVQNFLTVPIHLEQLLALGWFMSLDAFLYVFTFLPLRVAYSLVCLYIHIHQYVHWCVLRVLGGNGVYGSGFGGSSSVWFTFHRTQFYDLMRGAMVLIGFVVLSHINMSQVYHFIRGQSFIKLYVLAGMLEVLDKLLSSFGQDTFDAQTRTNPASWATLGYFAATSCYVCIHSMLYFVVVATLTVVVNSSDEALVTVLVLNNFA